MQSYLEASLLLWLRQHRIPEPQQQFRFNQTRRWKPRFCMAGFEGSPSKLKAWGVRTVGPQVIVPGPGSSRTAEKYESAMRLGWTVYRVPGTMDRK